jgi:hypothetical protein
MDASTTDDVRGFTSVTSQSGDGGRNIGGRAYVYSDGPSHNQSIGYYARIIQKSGSDGALPPSAGLYIDSRNSDYRPFGAILDDEMSIWKHGIVLNGDYSDTLVRHPNFKILPNGNIETDGTITQQGDKQPRLRELHRGVPPSGSTETFNLNTVLPRDNSSWMVHISSSMDRSDYTNRGFEGQFRYYSGYDSNGDNFERVTNIIQPTAFGSQHSLSHDGSGTLSYSGGTVNYRAEIVVEARRLG